MTDRHLTLIFVLLPLVAVLFSVSCVRKESPAVPQAVRDDVRKTEDAGSYVLRVRFDHATAARLSEYAPSGVFSVSDVEAKASSDEVFDVVSSMGVSYMRRIFPDAGEFEPRHKAAGLDRWYEIRYGKEDVSLTKAENGLEALPSVEIVEAKPDTRLTSFNDPLFRKQWALFNDGSVGPGFSAGCDINVVPVWQDFTCGDKDVIVAVIDDGINIDHEDLSSVVIPPGINGSRNFIYGLDPWELVPGDHGSHVSGIIAAINGNGKGICGVAGGNDGTGGVKLLSCQIFADNPDGSDRLQGDPEAALVWAADHGAVIANNSWGYSYDTEEDARKGMVSWLFKSAVDYFVENAGTDAYGNQAGPMKGGLVLFSSGNDGWGYGHPGDYEPILCVGALAPDFTRTYYSNYGEWVDICAPGGDGGYTRDGMILSCGKDGYISMSGTSMSCPYVSGVASLLVSYFGGPGFTCEDLKSLLLTGMNVEDVKSASGIGGLVDAYASFSCYSDDKPDRVEEYAVKAEDNRITFEWAMTRVGDIAVPARYVVALGKNIGDVEKFDPLGDNPGLITAELNTKGKRYGDRLSFTVRNLDYESDYYATIAAVSARNLASDIAEVKKTSTGTDMPPVITPEFSEEMVVKAHQTLDFRFRITDPNQDELNVRLIPGSTAVSGDFVSGIYTLTISGHGAVPGEYDGEIVADDSHGGICRYPFRYTLLENHAPEVTGIPDNILFSYKGEKITLNMKDYFTDIDGEELTYSMQQSPENIVDYHCDGASMNLVSLTFSGLSDIRVTAADASGENASLVFKAAVRIDALPVDISFENPVLSVHDGKDAPSVITLYNSNGAQVFREEGRSSIFDPLDIDLSSLAPGRYEVRAEVGGKTSRKNILRL